MCVIIYIASSVLHVEGIQAFSMTLSSVLWFSEFIRGLGIAYLHLKGVTGAVDRGQAV